MVMLAETGSALDWRQSVQGDLPEKKWLSGNIRAVLYTILAQEQASFRVSEGADIIWKDAFLKTGSCFACNKVGCCSRKMAFKVSYFF